MNTTPHALTATATFGITPKAGSYDNGFYVGDLVTDDNLELALNLFLTSYRLPVDVDMAKLYKTTLRSMSAGMTSLAPFEDSLRGILIASYCRNVIAGDVRYIDIIRDHSFSLGDRVYEMCPPHKRWRKHASLIAREYIAAVKRSLKSIEDESVI